MMNFCLDRRHFIKSTILSGLSVTLPIATLSEISMEKKPNILLFFTDDQRFDTIHALGNPHILTPNIDRLVERGITFTNAYIMGGQTGAICMPSRAMLMTGKSLFRLIGNGREIPISHIMMPELFRMAGYVTFGTGKWHNDPAAYHRCFCTGDEIFFGGMEDHWNVPVYDFDPNGEYGNVTPVVRNPWASNRIAYRRANHLTLGKHSSELFSDAAIQFLNTHESDKPFFCYISYTAPHDPRTMPKKYLDMYDPKEVSLPENFQSEHPFDNGDLRTRDEKLTGFPRDPQEIRKHIAEYYAMITHLDALIGRVLEALQMSGHAENTIIVFAGDNGLAVGQHGLMGKQNVYEHSVHVPLIMSGPGIPQNEKRDVLCYLNDIFPTLCDLTRFSIPESVEGMSLAPIIRDPKKKHRDALLFAYKNYQRGLRTSRWKLIHYNVEGNKNTQLFDLKSDPWEKHNLARRSDQQKRLGELTELMKKFMKTAGDQVILDKENWRVR